MLNDFDFYLDAYGDVVDQDLFPVYVLYDISEQCEIFKSYNKNDVWDFFNDNFPNSSIRFLV